ncbi:LLM class flavin-dependent oxidoreductase [Paraburkholderia youngii]|uniref:LLM class flavin-dependent oxidoreductase n=1 Tax=Paraburkholderia youngii TaxID=2782701 RepID=UPI0015920C5E|nr:LLM class flavin-dependent oxidoreductase [Paraburkholderia youngii]NUX57648.1 LLM class flavin-dependent oxidoreductase [Paraburkholderia youngii]
MIPISVLDLVMIGEGNTLQHSLADAVRLAQHVEASGFNRYWVAEHHNMPGIGSAATTLIMSHLAARTSSIRIGSGGIMMPNHAALIVAEQFGTLEALYPGRIDLGVGRAPGSDSVTSRAIRGTSQAPRELADDVVQLLDYFADNGRQPVRAVPGEHNIPIWVLGSGLYGAQLAAAFGLPFVFASHFAPSLLQQAVYAYRSTFKASRFLTEPYVMAGVNVFAADTEEEAAFLASSHQQWVANLHANKPGPLPRPKEGFMKRLSVHQREGLERELACTALGTRSQVRRWLLEFVEHFQVDELMIDARIYDVEARCRSYQYAAEALSSRT